ncbi:MAG: hypothetical protein ACREN3_09515, partial [Gemmatimonadaceae bacterium]
MIRRAMRAFPALIAAAVLLPAAHASAQTPPTHIRTRWARDVSRIQPWPEYPRPQLVCLVWT